MTTLDKFIQRSRDLCAKATPGPWEILWKGSGPYVGNQKIDQKRIDVMYKYHKDDFIIAAIDGFNNDKVIAENDATFIAHHNPEFISKLLQVIDIQAKAIFDSIARADDYADSYNSAPIREAQAEVERILTGVEGKTNLPLAKGKE